SLLSPSSSFIIFRHVFLLPTSSFSFSFLFNATATTAIYTLSLHDALPISDSAGSHVGAEREPRGELRRRGDRVGADGLRAERDRHPLARGELERGRLLQPKVDLQDLG